MRWLVLLVLLPLFGCAAPEVVETDEWGGLPAARAAAIDQIGRDELWWVFSSEATKEGASIPSCLADDGEIHDLLLDTQTEVVGDGLNRVWLFLFRALDGPWLMAATKDGALAATERVDGCLPADAVGPLTAWSLRSSEAALSLPAAFQESMSSGTAGSISLEESRIGPVWQLRINARDLVGSSFTGPPLGVVHADTGLFIERSAYQNMTTGWEPAPEIYRHTTIPSGAGPAAVDLELPANGMKAQFRFSIDGINAHRIEWTLTDPAGNLTAENTWAAGERDPYKIVDTGEFDAGTWTFEADGELRPDILVQWCRPGVEDGDVSDCW